MDRPIILSVKDLTIKFKTRKTSRTIIRKASLDLFEGENLALVGESGSGKSVFTKSFLGLLDNNGWIESGQIIYKGKNLARYKDDKDWKKIRGKEIAMVFQEPMTSLNPLKTVGSQIKEAILVHSSLSKEEARVRTLEILEDVGIDKPRKRYSQYPHEFSGGMRQRIVIAIAIACRPRILICDEPTTALDVTIQAQILDLLKNLGLKYRLTSIYITHDLGVVANVADRVAVMYSGDIVEIGKVEEIFYNPKHPYTWALLSSLPHLTSKKGGIYYPKPLLFHSEEGEKGDPFAPRNPYALNIDFIKEPPYFQVSPSHKVKSWLMDPRAPKVKPPREVRNLRYKLGRGSHER